MPAYTVSQKSLIIQPILNETANIKTIAMLHNISSRSLYHWKSNRFCNNNYHVKHKSKIDSHVIASVKTFITNKFLFSAYDILKYLTCTLQIQISLSSVYNILKHKLDLSYKKCKPSLIRKDPEIHNDLVNKFINKINSYDSNSLLFLDETHFESKMRPLYGWSRKNEKIMVSTTKINNERYSVIATIGDKFLCHKKSKETINSERFIQYLTELRENKKGSLKIILDNARIHHAKSVKKYATENEIELIYNVPYSPETNPIEMIFSKVKHIFRKNRLEESDIAKNIKEAFKSISNQHILNAIQHSFLK